MDRQLDRFFVYMLLVYSIIVVIMLIAQKNPWMVILAYWITTALRNGLIVLLNGRRTDHQNGGSQ